MPFLLPRDHDPRRLPDPIPASYYARGASSAWAGWATLARGRPSRRVLAAAAIALAAVVLIGALVRLTAGHPSPEGQQSALGSAATGPAGSPPGSATPVAPSPTPSPTPTRRPTPTPPPTPLTITGLERHGRSVTLDATTAPRITCTIAVGYSPPPQLPQATSDEDGAVTWSWRVGAQVQPGTYPIHVTCGNTTRDATLTVS